jgi:hypothetical protein
MIDGNEWTTPIELFNLAKKYNIQLDNVVMKDELCEQFKKKQGRTGNIIINLMRSDYGNGSHWVGLHIGDKAIYFDSFGFPPPMEVIEYVRRLGYKRVYYNDVQYQHIDDGYCGQWVLYFLSQLENLALRCNSGCGVRGFDTTSLSDLICIKIMPSTRKNKRFMVNVGQKKIHFGSKNSQTFLEHNDEGKKRNWIKRHTAGNPDKINDIYSPLYWSLNILWNKPTLEESIKSIV